jgi:MFS family permease
MSIYKSTPPISAAPLLFWSISVSFVLFQFFLQLSSGLVINFIMKDLALTASQAGVLSSAYYYVYTGLQIPVGALLDKKNSRTLLTLNVFICSVGCLLFAVSQHFWSLVLSRMVIGAGSAFAFVGVSHILRQHFEAHKFSFMIGLSETLSFLVTVFFMLVIGFSHDIFWRDLMFDAGLCGLVLTGLCYTILPNDTPTAHAGYSVWKAIILLCKNKIAWANGLFVGFGFGFITVFGAMWAIPFIQLKTGCDIKTASVLDAMLFLGAGLSCPIFGEIDVRISNRRLVLFTSYFITAALLIFTLFMPITNLVYLGILLFIMGLTSGSYMLSYTIANEISPPKALSTSTGFANTLAVITAPIIQPLVGYLLDLSKQGSTYSLADYQFSLMVIPLGLLIGAGLVVVLPEKASKHHFLHCPTQSMSN